MHKVMRCVTDFHRSFGLPVNEDSSGITPELRRDRMKLLEMKYHDYRYAERDEDITRVADALADLVYVIAGTALCYGLPLEAIFMEVHRSNMSKLGRDGTAQFKSDGKVRKGPDYRPPKIDEILTDAWYGDGDEIDL